LPTPASSKPQPNPERIRHLLYGSLAAIDRTIKILYAYGYADPNDGRDRIPVPQNGTETEAASAANPWVVILTKTGISVELSGLGSGF